MAVAVAVCCVQWVKDNIGRYGGDEDMIFLSGRFFLADSLLLLPSRRATLRCWRAVLTGFFAAVGHSAGGHLAALLALDTRYMADVSLEPELVKGVVGICGVYDLVTGYTRFLVWFSSPPGHQLSPLVQL